MGLLEGLEAKQSSGCKAGAPQRPGGTQECVRGLGRGSRLPATTDYLGRQQVDLAIGGRLPAYGLRPGLEGDEGQGLGGKQLGAQTYRQRAPGAQGGYALPRQEDYELGRIELDTDGLGFVALREKPIRLVARQRIGVARVGQQATETEPDSTSVAALAVVPAADQQPRAHLT